MPLPDSRELREMLDEATPYPWRRACGYIRPARTDISWSIAAIEDEGGQIGGDEDIDLMLIAPQLAEEVIRLRDEINRVKHFCLDGCRVAEAEEARTTGETKALEQGKQVAYHVAYLELSTAQHGGDE